MIFLRHFFCVIFFCSTLLPPLVSCSLDCILIVITLELYPMPSLPPSWSRPLSLMLMTPVPDPGSSFPTPCLCEFGPVTHGLSKEKSYCLDPPFYSVSGPFDRHSFYPPLQPFKSSPSRRTRGFFPPNIVWPHTLQRLLPPPPSPSTIFVDPTNTIPT